MAYSPYGWVFFLNLNRFYGFMQFIKLIKAQNFLACPIYKTINHAFPLTQNALTCLSYLSKPTVFTFCDYKVFFANFLKTCNKYMLNLKTQNIIITHRSMDYIYIWCLYTKIKMLNSQRYHISFKIYIRNFLNHK